jgi:hypothetical protein
MKEDSLKRNSPPKFDLKTTVADMLRFYTDQVRSSYEEEDDEDLLEENYSNQEDIFKEPKGGKPKIVVKSMKSAPKKG